MAPSGTYIHELATLLPHRAPFLFIDRIMRVVPGVEAVCEWAVREDEPWLPGHFPGDPLVPGVLIVEAIAQTALLAHNAGLPADQRQGVRLGAVRNARFLRPVTPGDRLTLEGRIVRRIGQVRVGNGLARREGQVVARATLTFVCPATP